MEMIGILPRYSTMRYLTLFADPAQLSVAFSTEKQGEAGIFSHVSMM